jgi:hypothetical protein
VTSCVDAAGLYRADPQTGRPLGTVFGAAKWNAYQEQAAAGRDTGGQWFVNGTYNYPATDGGTAGECTQ